MKLGVYGDSFGTSKNPAIKTAWYNLLGEMLGATVETHAVGGSSVYYSYKRFLATHERYDVIVFMVSDPIRYTRDISEDFPDLFLKTAPLDNFRKMLPIPNQGMVSVIREKLIKDGTMTKTQEKILDDLNGWFNSVDIEYNTDMVELMLSNIETIHSDVIFYPGFKFSMANDRMLKTGIDNRYNMLSLVDEQAHKLKIKNFNLLQYSMKENEKTMSAHLGPEYNATLANLFYSKITVGKWDWSDFDNIVITNPTDFYYLNQ